MLTAGTLSFVASADAAKNPRCDTETGVCYVVVESGDGWLAVARAIDPTLDGQALHDFAVALEVANGGNGSLTQQLHPGRLIVYLPADTTTTTTEVTTSTTTTVPTTSTTISTTSTTPTTSTLAPTSTSSTTTTTTSTSTTSTSSTSSTVPSGTQQVHTVDVGDTLPSEATCAAQVVGMTENRPNNATPNAARGTSPNDEYPRVTGNYTGTTDEIIQWAACKWGIDVDWVRAQTAIESWWQQETVGDNGESFGILQVRRPYHQTAFEDENAVLSTAYNIDYAYSVWRRCFEGEYTWLNTVERGRDYTAGDGMGCIGLWFSGRWYTDAATGYMGRVSDYHTDRIWLTPDFGPATPTGGTPSTSTPSTQPPASSSTTPSTQPPASTSPPTTAAPTTAPSTSVPTQPGTWQPVAPPGPTTDPNFHHAGGNFGFQSIAAAPDGTLYVSADYQGLWRSTDQGATWVKVSTDGTLETGTPWTIQVDPFNSDVLWANAGYGAGGPLRSTNGGATWSLRAVGAPTQSNDVYSIALDPAVEGHMLVAWHSPWTTGSAGITESFDGGQTWINHPAPSGAWGSGHAVYFLSSNTWLVGTQNDGIWRTTNSGTNWSKVSSTPITHGATGFMTRVGSTLFIAHEGVISRSGDNGATWSNITSGLPGGYYSAVASDGVNLYTAPSFPSAGGYNNGQWYVRPVSGGTWTPIAESVACYRGQCNGPRQTVRVGTAIFTSNYSGGVWRLTPP